MKSLTDNTMLRAKRVYTELSKHPKFPVYFQALRWDPPSLKFEDFVNKSRELLLRDEDRFLKIVTFYLENSMEARTDLGAFIHNGYKSLYELWAEKYDLQVGKLYLYKGLSDGSKAKVVDWYGDAYSALKVLVKLEQWYNSNYERIYANNAGAFTISALGSLGSFLEEVVVQAGGPVYINNVEWFKLINTFKDLYHVDIVKDLVYAESTKPTEFKYPAVTFNFLEED